MITTVAGNGTAGYSGDGGQATAAELDRPLGHRGGQPAGTSSSPTPATTGSARSNLSTGVITTVAGNGTAGYSGDGGQATAAELDDPYGVAVDASGDLFIADDRQQPDPRGQPRHGRDHHRGRQWDRRLQRRQRSGHRRRTRLPHTASRWTPAGTSSSPTRSNNRIREVNHATGLITTVAGNGTAGYSGDNGQATAAELYYPAASRWTPPGTSSSPTPDNDRIREVNLSTGVITTVAGNGTAGYSGDNGQATAAELSNARRRRRGRRRGPLHRRQRNNRIREVNHATGVIHHRQPATADGSRPTMAGSTVGDCSTHRCRGRRRRDLFNGDTFSNHPRDHLPACHHHRTGRPWHSVGTAADHALRATASQLCDHLRPGHGDRSPAPLTVTADNQTMVVRAGPNQP